MVGNVDPDLVFANFGDVDRMGHADVSGTTLEAARKAALASSDSQIGGFVDHLTATGRWGSSTMLVLADYSMDWSTPDRVISLQRAMDADPTLAGRTKTAQNGGADLLYYTGPANERDTAVEHMRNIAAATDGVLSVHAPAELRLGSDAGDLVAYCEAGWRFTDPYVTSNPIPGNHGHPATKPIPFFTTGGHPAVRPGISSPEPARTIDVAPTIGSLFGLPAPDGEYDGTPRTAGIDISKL